MMKSLPAVRIIVINVDVCREILDTTSYSYKIADDGQQAVNMFRSHSPRVICMDLSMPVLNGFEATKIIRDMESGTGMRTPIIGVTAHALSGDKVKCLEAGMDDYMTKPVFPDALLEKIGYWLRNRQSDAA